jgi:hypothetical protein
MDNFPQIELLKPAKVDDRLREVHGVVQEVSDSVVAVVAEKATYLTGGVVVIDRKDSLVPDDMVGIRRLSAYLTLAALFLQHPLEFRHVNAVGSGKVRGAYFSSLRLAGFFCGHRNPVGDFTGNDKPVLLAILSRWLLRAARLVVDHVQPPEHLATSVRAFFKDVPARTRLYLLGLARFPGSPTFDEPLMGFTSRAFGARVVSFCAIRRSTPAAVKFIHALNQTAHAADLFSGECWRSLVAFFEVPAKILLAHDLLAEWAIANSGFFHCCGSLASRIKRLMAAERLERQYAAILSSFSLVSLSNRTNVVGVRSFTDIAPILIVSLNVITVNTKRSFSIA